ncbi:MAG: adenylyl-sulfate kinase [Deltaproteobacteria bacterium]|nr:adenylyl-sulfate kinase [Deltaproteobacteria bacterium]
MKNNSPKKNNVKWFNGFVSQEDREILHGHKGTAVWLTGLSASGKSTIAHHLEKQLHKMGHSTYVFDGDNVRHGLCEDLGFSGKDRSENIRRIGEMTRLFIDAGIIAITAFISPYKKDREIVRKLTGKDRFIEVYVKCPIDVCESRDPKGIYQKAKKGDIQNFTGISAPYETPENPDITIESNIEDIHSSVKKVLQFLEKRRLINNKFRAEKNN